MSTQEISVIGFVLSICLLLIAFKLWLDAESDLNKSIKLYYAQPRIKRFPFKRNRLRKLLLSLFTFPVIE